PCRPGYDRFLGIVSLLPSCRHHRSSRTSLDTESRLSTGTFLMTTFATSRWLSLTPEDQFCSRPILSVLLNRYMTKSVAQYQQAESFCCTAGSRLRTDSPKNLSFE